MRKKNKSGYWREIFPLWKKEFRLWFGLESWGQLITKLIGNIIPVWVIFAVGGNAEKFFDEVIARAITWCILAIWAMFILTITYIRANVNLHKKQKEFQNNQSRKIYKLQKLANSETVKTKEVKFAPKEEYAKDEKGDHYAYLEISNGEEMDLRDCYANLEVLKIRYSDKDNWVNWLNWMSGNTNFLTWPNFDTAKDEKTVRRKKTERINIAKMKAGGYPIFIFGDGREEAMPVEEIYIEVSLNGKLNGKPIDEITFCGFLKREQGFYIQDGATITTTIAGVSQKVAEPSERIPEWRVYIVPGELKDEKDK